MSLRDEDKFVGLWKLKPEQSNYQFGAPPANGCYRIARHERGYLISMEWQTAEGDSHEMSYESVPDGQDHVYENPAIADTVSMTRVDERTLDSASKKDGVVTAHARRVLSESGQEMVVSQSGHTPDGRPFTNLSVYERIG